MKIETVIAEALHACGVWKPEVVEVPTILAALKAARIAVVELPEHDKYGRFWYGNHCNYTFVDTGEVETSRVYQRIDVPTLREYVAALLAAADVAEASQ